MWLESAPQNSDSDESRSHRRELMPWRRIPRCPTDPAPVTDEPELSVADSHEIPPPAPCARLSGRRVNARWRYTWTLGPRGGPNGAAPRPSWGFIWDSSVSDLGSSQGGVGVVPEDRSGVDPGSVWGVGTRRIWDRCGADLGSVGSRSSVDPRSMLSRPGVGAELRWICWVPSGVHLGDRSGVDPGTVRGRSWVELGSLSGVA